MHRRITTITFLIIFALFAITGCQTATEKKPVPKQQNKAAAATATLIEAAGKDPYTNGCVSCHKKEGDVDRTLSEYVKRIKGHQQVTGNSVSTCYGCHEAQKNYEWYTKFFRGIHRAHWKSEIFYTKSKGQCYSCHTVESNGVSGIKDYPLAGYRSGTSGAATAPKETTQSGTTGTTKATKPETSKPEKATPEETQGGGQISEQGQTSGGQTSESGQTQQEGLAVPQSTGFDEIPTPTP